MKICQTCGASYSNRIDFCFHDGSVLQSSGSEQAAPTAEPSASPPVQEASSAPDRSEAMDDVPPPMPLQPLSEQQTCPPAPNVSRPGSSHAGEPPDPAPDPGRTAQDDPEEPSSKGPLPDKPAFDRQPSWLPLALVAGGLTAAALGVFALVGSAWLTERTASETVSGAAPTTSTPSAEASGDEGGSRASSSMPADSSEPPASEAPERQDGTAEELDPTAREQAEQEPLSVESWEMDVLEDYLPTRTVDDLLRGQGRGAGSDSQVVLEVSSEPEGAQVRLDGEIHGETPISLDVAPGRYLLELEKDGYSRVIRYLDFRADLQVPIELEADPAD